MKERNRKMMGKTETEVSRWLSGTHNLTLATLCKISVALGQDVITIPKHHPYSVFQESIPAVAEAEAEYN